MLTTVSYQGWPNCQRLANSEIELIVTTEVGPRVIRCGWIGGPNLFREFADQIGRVGGDEWRAYGGHRFWHAPEAVPRTYWPDNVSVAHRWDGRTLTLTQPTEGTTGLAKELALTLDPVHAHVRVAHRLTNHGVWDVEAAPWALSVMAPGGRAILPHEPYRSHPEALLPARPLVLWHYTDMSDPRWTWGKRYIQLQQDPNATECQKIGLRNSLGWAAYYLGDQLFLKRFGFEPAATYPDFGSSTEVFTNSDMLEVESLGPLAVIPPGGTICHVEDWFLHRVALGLDEASLDAGLMPLVEASERVLSALDTSISHARQ